MHSIQLSALKSNLDKVIEELENNGEELVLEYGKQHKKVAVLIPYKKFIKNKENIKFGYLKNKAEIEIKKDFAITDSELIYLCN